MKRFVFVLVLVIITLTFAVSIFSFFFSKKINPQQGKPTDETETVIPSEPSEYQDFTKEGFDKAINEKQIIVLYFIANWCTECSQQENINKEVFEDLKKESVKGFKIHISDSETTEETKNLAKKFDIVNQHTFVFLNKNGAVHYKTENILSSQELKDKILELN